MLLGPATTSLSLLALLATPAAWCTQGDPGPEGGPVPARPDPPTPQVTEGPDLTTPRLQTGAMRGVPVAVPVEHDDGVPLPTREVIQCTPQGDSILQPASGDPHFLGFAAGAYYPPAEELLDPELLFDAFGPALDDERPSDEVYGFVMFQKRMTRERLGELEALGVRSLGLHPQYCLKAALPVERLDLVAALPFVRWVGSPRSWQKLHPAMGSLLTGPQPGDRIRVWINVYESDLNDASQSEVVAVPSFVSPAGIEQLVPAAVEALPRRWMSNGWMQRALQQRGVEVRSYSDQTATFECSLPPELVESLLELDFIQFIEPRAEQGLGAAPPHDESTPMISSDRVRATYSGGANQAVIVGHIDSGIDLSHVDLNIWGAGWSCVTNSGADMWLDSGGHGSHTAGTLLGRGIGTDDHRGNAPGLASWGSASRLFGLKMFGGDFDCTWNHDTIVSVFQNPSGGTPIPHLVTNSWGTWFLDGTPAVGSEYGCRVMDNQIHDFDQAWIFAAGNFGSNWSTMWIEASAKNVLAVGNVNDYLVGTRDPSYLASDSSRGPCADGRWKPNLVAPGDSISSVATNTGNGYTSKRGTSMATPHVSGVAAQLLDAYPGMRHSPEMLASWLMASAMTKDDSIITGPTTAHLNAYGAGRVEAYKAMYYDSDMEVLANWNWDASSSSWYPGDFTIPAGTTRMVAVMHYIEPACSSGASKALVSDWDMWLDQDPIDTVNGNTGDWLFHQSTVDNTEIRILDNPQPGPWRVKAYPDNASGTVKMSVTIYAIYADTTPDGTTTLTPSSYFVQPNENVSITALASNPDYVASAVFLDTSGDGFNLVSATMNLKDGVVADMRDNAHFGYKILLGDIYNGATRSAEWTVSYGFEGVKAFRVDSRSENWEDESDTVYITVDGTPPPLVTNLGSSSHTTGVWSNNPSVTLNWTQPPDPLSGVSGYAIFETLGAPAAPGYTQNLGNVQTYLASYPSDTSGRYFNIRPVDRSGNWAPSFSWTGPYNIDTVEPGPPPGLGSSTHTGGAFSCANVVTMDWDDAPDTHSWVPGYSVEWSHTLSTTPDTTEDTSETQWTQSVPSSSLPWYFHVRARDAAGNWGPASSWGPITIDSTPPSNYCAAVANSTGQRARMHWSNSFSITANNFRLSADRCPANKPGLFLYGTTQAEMPAGDGHLCVTGNLQRLPVVNTGPAGVPSHTVDFTNPPNPAGQIYPGDTRYFSFWFRDPAGGPAGFNFADGLMVRFCP